MNKYHGSFESRDDLSCFCGGYDQESRDKFIQDEIPREEDILLAVYEEGIYDGSVFVLFRKDGKLYEVNGEHCSCHGLEGQWVPEETTWEALKIRQNHLTGYAELQEMIKANV